MRKRWERLGKLLVHGVIFCTVTVVVLQGAVTLYPLELFTGWAERMSAPLEAPALLVQAPMDEAVQKDTLSPCIAEEKVCLTLELKEIAALPDCRVLVNGQDTAGFEEQQIEIIVQEGDLLEVDATCYNFPIEITVQSASHSLLQPRPDRSYRVEQGIILLGELRCTP